MKLDIKKAMILIETICCEWDSENPTVNSIYRIAHCFSKSCENPHLDWKEELKSNLK